MYGRARKIISLVLSIGLLFQQVSFAQLAAELNIANYLTRLGSNLAQERFRPPHLSYFSYDSLSDNFKLLLDKGDVKNLRANELKSSTQNLLNYFLVGVSLPDSMFWVNLRPDSEDQIIDQYLEKTDVGKIMLEADLQLKKDTALFTSPATPEGREYWNRLYKKAGELYGYDAVTIPTLTRPWIVPGEIIVRESKDSAYVYKAGLKVMLEQDYLKDSSAYNFKDERSKALNEYSSQLIRELIIPKLTKEVNSSKRYASLRQVYYSLILARWFKLRFSGKPGTYASLINSQNLTNLTSKESWSKTDYFKQYQKSFSEGEYNVKEPVYTPTGQTIRSYFSGGIDVASSAINTKNGILGQELSFSKLSQMGIVVEGNSVSGIRISSSSSMKNTPTAESQSMRDLLKQSYGLYCSLPITLQKEYLRVKAAYEALLSKAGDLSDQSQEIAELIKSVNGYLNHTLSAMPNHKEYEPTKLFIRVIRDLENKIRLAVASSVSQIQISLAQALKQKGLTVDLIKDFIKHNRPSFHSYDFYVFHIDGKNLPSDIAINAKEMHITRLDQDILVQFAKRQEEGILFSLDLHGGNIKVEGGALDKFGEGYAERLAEWIMSIFSENSDATGSPITKEEAIAALEARNQEGKSNLPQVLFKENIELFQTAREHRLSIYSKLDKTIYVWGADGLEKVLLEEYGKKNNDEKMTSIITIDQDGVPISALSKEEGRIPVFDAIFRQDRQIQWIDAIVNPDFNSFKVPSDAKRIPITGMTQYISQLPSNRVVLEDVPVKNSLIDVLNQNGIKVVWVFDGEKGKFIPTFRGRELPFENEDLEYGLISMPVLLNNAQVSSFKPDVVLALEKEKGQNIAWFYGEVPKELEEQKLQNSQYWQYAGLSGFRLLEANVKKIREATPGTMGVTNVPLPDLIGHVAIKNLAKVAKLFIEKEDGTFEVKEGNGWDSVLACLSISDTIVGNILKEIEKKQGVAMLVGDHGSVDDMTQPGHSFNDVSLFVVDFKNKDIKLVKSRGNIKNTQADVAVTALHILGITKPAEMSGNSLLPDSYVGSKDRIVWQIILDGFGYTDFKDPQNAFGVAIERGLMPTIKSLYDEDNFVVLKAGGHYAGLRGGRQEDFVAEEIKTRQQMLDEVARLHPESIFLTNYDYRDILGTTEKLEHKEGLLRLKDDPFLNDKDFVVRVVPNTDGKVIKIFYLDPSQMGSTEYNLATLGGGRIVEQSIVVLDKAFINGKAFILPGMKAYIQEAQGIKTAYIVSILQEAGVHASLRHLYYIVKHLKEQGVERFVFKLGLDGRDESGQNGINRIRELRKALKLFKIADSNYSLSVLGREIAFDRDNKWKAITAPFVNELLWGTRRDLSLEQAIAASPVQNEEVKNKALKQQVDSAFELLGDLISSGKLTKEQIEEAIKPIRVVVEGGFIYSEHEASIVNLGRNLELPNVDKRIIVKGIQAWAKLCNVDRDAAKGYLREFNSISEGAASSAVQAISDFAELVAQLAVYADVSFELSKGSLKISYPGDLPAEDKKKISVLSDEARELTVAVSSIIGEKTDWPSIKFLQGTLADKIREELLRAARISVSSDSSRMQAPWTQKDGQYRPVRLMVQANDRTDMELLKSIGADGALTGHSETRELYALDNASVNKLLKESQYVFGSINILAMGEPADLRDSEGKLTALGWEFIRKQVIQGLAGFTKEQILRTIIAYEPIWAIGPKAIRAAKADEAEEVHKFIRQILSQIIPGEEDKIIIQYGGSMSAKNATDLMAMLNVDGGLIGGASLTKETAVSLIKTIVDTVRRQKQAGTFSGRIPVLGFNLKAEIGGTKMEAAYLTELMNFAKFTKDNLEGIDLENEIRIFFAVSDTDISLFDRALKGENPVDFIDLSQAVLPNGMELAVDIDRVSAVKPGANTSSITPEALRLAGVKKVLLKTNQIDETDPKIIRAREAGLGIVPAASLTYIRASNLERLNNLLNESIREGVFRDTLIVVPPALAREAYANIKDKSASSSINKVLPFRIDSSALFSDTMKDAQFTQNDKEEIAPKLQEISAKFKKEIEDAKTPEGRDRLSKNLRGWLLPWVNLLDQKSVITDPMDNNGALARENEVIQQVIDVAAKVRNDNIEAWVNIGVGGSDLPTQTLVNTNISKYHNELSVKNRGGAPRVYFTGNDFSPDLLYNLLFNLDSKGLLFKAKFNVVSKSGTTAETAAAYLIIRSYLVQRLEELSSRYQKNEIDISELWMLGLSADDVTPIANEYKDKLGRIRTRQYFKTGRFFIATTGLNAKSAFYQLNNLKLNSKGDSDPFYAMLPVPEGTGGRFSAFTPVGLLALGVVAPQLEGKTVYDSVKEQVYEALRGVKSALKEMLTLSSNSDENIVFASARNNFLLEQKKRGTQLFYIYDPALKEIGEMMGQLSSESLQEKGQGSVVLPLVGSNKNHSYWNGVKNGPRSVFVTFIRSANYKQEYNLRVPEGSGIKGDVSAIEGFRLGDIQLASQEGTAQDATASGVPNYSITIPKRDVFNVSKLLYTLQSVVAVEGKLRGLEIETRDDGTYVDLTYLQSGVEDYKTNTKKVLAEMRMKKSVASSAIKTVVASDDSVFEIPDEFIGVKFGTSGHRGENDKQLNPGIAAAIAQGIVGFANQFKDFTGKNKVIVIGGDSRPFNKAFQEEETRVALANGFKVLAFEKAMPTPIGSFVIRYADELFELADNEQVVGTINNTPSHNPRKDGGIKLNPGGEFEGAPSEPNVNNVIQEIANGIIENGKGITRLPDATDFSRHPNYTRIDQQKVFDVYIRHVEKLIDFGKIRRAIREKGLTWNVSTMNGAAGWWMRKAFEAVDKNFFTLFHEEPLPDFGDLPLGPNTEKIEKQKEYFKDFFDKQSDGKGATDGDGDRFYLADENGNKVNFNVALALVFDYMLNRKGMDGSFLTCVDGTGMFEKIGKVAPRTRIGFKEFQYALKDKNQNVIFAGEGGSGGLTLGGHILDKDGIVAQLIFVEMTADAKLRGLKISDLVSELYKKYGYYVMLDTRSIPIDSDVKTAEEVKKMIPQMLAERYRVGDEIFSGFKIDSIDTTDGLKFFLKEETTGAIHSMLIRPSGTGKEMRDYTEAVSLESFEDGLRIANAIAKNEDALVNQLISEAIAKITSSSAISESPTKAKFLKAYEEANGDIVEIAKKLGVSLLIAEHYNRIYNPPVSKTASSAVETETPERMGAIDFRAMNIAIQPMGSFQGLNFKLPQLSQQELGQIDIPLEVERVKNMVDSGTSPSGSRIKELIAACKYKKQEVYINDLFICLLDGFKIEQENALESSPDSREALVVADMLVSQQA